jgi:hypothetical protein
MVDQEVARQAGHPGCKPAVDRAVASERPEHPEKNLLTQILGLVPAAGEPVTKAVNAPRMASH